MAERKEQVAASSTSTEQTTHASEFIKAQTGQPEIKFLYTLNGDKTQFDGSFSHAVSFQEEQSFSLPEDAQLVNLLNEKLIHEGSEILYEKVVAKNLIVTVVPSDITCKSTLPPKETIITQSVFMNLAGFSVQVNEVVSGLTQYSVNRKGGKELAEKINSTAKFNITISSQGADRTIVFQTTWGSQENDYLPSLWQSKNEGSKQVVESQKTATLSITGGYLIYEIKVQFKATITGGIKFKQQGSTDQREFNITQVFPGLKQLQLGQQFKASKVADVKGTFNNNGQVKSIELKKTDL